MRGIDVSRYQSSVNWAKVDASGIDFALIKGGYGDMISQKESTFDADVQQALAHGLHVGAYWFSYAVSVADAQKEADVFNAVLAPYRGKLTFPVAFDFEYDSANYFQRTVGRAPTNAEITAFADAFLSRLKGRGWFVNLYTNCDYIRSGKFSAAILKKFDVWLADYAGGPDYPCYIQQTGDKGSVPGISGGVDIDVSYRDYPTMIRAGGYNGFKRQQNSAVGIDTTQDIHFAQGQTYIVATSADATPAVTAGTAGVVKLEHTGRTGIKDYFRLTFVGKSGQATGIFTAAEGETPIKRFVAYVK